MIRKLIWGCAASSALAVCGAFAAANYAMNHPHSLVGRALHGASHIAAFASPYHGFGPIVARMHSAATTAKDEVAIDIEGLPEDPMPHGAAVSGPIEAPKEAAPIVIPEGKPLTATAVPPETTEVPVSKELTAPATMPPVGDGEESELPMPKMEVEVEVEYRGWWQTVTDWFRISTPCAKETTALDHWGVEPIEEQGKKGECREDGNYHHHYPGCPYTGRPHCPKTEKPAAMPPLPLKNDGYDFSTLGKRLDGSEEPSEEGAKSSALKTIRKIGGRITVPMERAPARPAVDTMEYRLSDQPLSDYGSGPL